MMKKMIKKTAGIMLACSMLCAIMATGCTKKEATTNDNKTEATSATSSVTSSTTSSATSSAKLEFAEQTLVDKVTGVEVTGMLPVGAEVLTDAEIISAVDLYDVFDSPYSLEGDFKKLSGSIGDYEEYQADRKVENIGKIMNLENWAQWEGYGGGMLEVRVCFVKDSQIIDVESDFTVTMPFNYRRGLVTGGITDEAVAVHYDYDNNEFSDVELVTADETPKGMFQFKAKDTGLFFLGGESNIAELKDFYENHYE